MLDLLAALGVTFCGGLLAHQLRAHLARLQNGWRELSSYASGLLFMLPFFILIHHALRRSVACAGERALLAYLLAAAFFGGGVAGGYFADTFVSDKDE